MEVPRHWRLKKQRYSLVGEICNSCRTPVFPPRAVCPHCGGDAKLELTYQNHQHVMAIEENVESLVR